MLSLTKFSNAVTECNDMKYGFNYINHNNHADDYVTPLDEHFLHKNLIDAIYEKFHMLLTNT